MNNMEEVEEMKEVVEKFKSSSKYFMFSMFRLVISIITKGLVFSKLWLWFIVPIFNINTISILQSFGIFVLIRFSCMKIDYNKIKKLSNNEPLKINEFLFDMLFTFVVLFIGYILTIFM